MNSFALSCTDTIPYILLLDCLIVSKVSLQTERHLSYIVNMGTERLIYKLNHMAVINWQEKQTARSIGRLLCTQTKEAVVSLQRQRE